jgi:hypothetical protein
VAEAIPHIHLPRPGAIPRIHLHRADHQAPLTADPVAIQFPQEVLDLCLPDLTAELAGHHHHIAADQYQEAVVPTHQVVLHLAVHHQVVPLPAVLHQVAVAAEDIRRRRFNNTIQLI